MIVTVYASGGLERESIREYGMVPEFRGRRYGRCHAVEMELILKLFFRPWINLIIPSVLCFQVCSSVAPESFFQFAKLGPLRTKHERTRGRKLGLFPEPLALHPRSPLLD